MRAALLAKNFGVEEESNYFQGFDLNVYYSCSGRLSIAVGTALGRPFIVLRLLLHRRCIKGLVTEDMKNQFFHFSGFLFFTWVISSLKLLVLECSVCFFIIPLYYTDIVLYM